MMQEIRQLIVDEFDVTYHPNYIHDPTVSVRDEIRQITPKTARKCRQDRRRSIDETSDDPESGDDEPVTDGGYVGGLSTQRGHSRLLTAGESGRSTSQK